MIILEDVLILARTIYGEARSEDDPGQRAVVHVILNRWRDKTRRRDHTIAATCLRWRQFSAFNEGDPNRAKLLTVTVDDPIFRGCLRAALHAVDEPDFTKGSTHYHVRDMVPPRWARGKTPAFATRFHLFYNDVR